jgi:four helix bundle protein
MAHAQIGCVVNSDSFRNLKVWQQSMRLVEEVYRATRAFPADERFGLTSQIRRACVSVASNIGEGRRRKSQRAYLYHLDVALGSQGEVEVQLEIARRIGLLAEEDFHSLHKRAEEVGKMLNGLIASLERAN